MGGGNIPFTWFTWVEQPSKHTAVSNSSNNNRLDHISATGADVDRRVNNFCFYINHLKSYRGKKKSKIFTGFYVN